MIKNFLINTGLVLLSIVVTLFCVDRFFLSNLHNFPLKLHPYLHEFIQPLAQPSKSGTVPEGYILMLGDSYAKGYGDWLFQADFDKNPSFHSGDVIHEETGMDLITLGKSGAGSIRGIIYQLAAFEGKLSTSGFDFPEPKHVLVYFYEGNDLNNNMHEPTKIRLTRDSSALQIRDRLAAYYQEVFDYNTQEKSQCGMTLTYCFFHNVMNVELPILPRKQWTMGEKNLISLTNGEVVAAPDRLQSPAMELSAEERNYALKIFEESLKVVLERLPEAKFTIVYIPSPITSYNFVGDTVSIETYQNGSEVQKAGDVLRRSRLISNSVKGIADKHNLSFIDTSDDIRKLSATTVIHGPMDWYHFNESGYRELAKSVLKQADFN